MEKFGWYYRMYYLCQKLLSMIVTVVLEQSDLNNIHDRVLSVTGEKPTNEECQKIWDELPEDIQGMAIRWGTGDTEFRDNLYDWLSGWIKK